MLKTLAARFENRTFLPQLRDVQRLLDRAGYPHGRLKSRCEAARHVMKMLSRPSTDELNQFNSIARTKRRQPLRSASAGKSWGGTP